MAENPSNRVHDIFRKRSAGVVDAPFNSKPTADNFHVDQSRLGVHEEYDPEVKNDWGGTGKFVKKPNSITDNARASMGDIRGCGSYKPVDAPKEPTNEGCCPAPYYPSSGRNPVTRRRGDD